MRKVNINDTISAEIDEDYVRIEDDLNGEVSLDGDDFRSLMTVFIQEGGITT